MKVFVLLFLVGTSFASPQPKKVLSTNHILVGNPSGSKIIGGVDAAPNEFPWQISFQVTPPGSSAYHSCGGTIVDERHVITAAHCIMGRSLSEVEIVVGAHNVVNTSETTQQRIKPKRMIIHPDYNQLLSNNDVGVVVLSEPLDFNKVGVAPIKLAPANLEPTGECINTGWGVIDQTGGIDIVPEILQKVNLNIFERTACRVNYIGVAFLDDSHICATGGEGKGSCNGDSGGPLVCKESPNATEWYLAGAVSFGMQPCGQARYPTVFANIAHLRPFIDSEMAQP